MLLPLKPLSVKQPRIMCKSLVLIGKLVLLNRSRCSTQRAFFTLAKIRYFQDQSPLILCVLDGNENVFTDNLLKQGQQGGRQAAQQFTKGIAQYLSNEDVHLFGRLSFWITIYFNKSGLLDNLMAHNKCSAEQFEAFCVGFSQASPRFLMIDVGPGKEVADAKIREYLQTYTRFPQTLRVFFGGMPTLFYIFHS